MTSASTGFEAVRVESKADASYQRLLDAIKSGALAAGAELNEVQLAQQLGVSRTPLRDAVNRLHQDGLIETGPGRLARVRSFDAAEFVDIYNTRLALETTAVRLCARDGADLGVPAAVLEQIGALTEAQQPDHLRRLETAFHVALVEASGNRVLARSFAAIGAQLQTALAANPPAPGRLSDVVDSHRELLEVIATGDERAAADAVQLHIFHSVDAALVALGTTTKALLPPTAALYADRPRTRSRKS